jgi:hypothetical protein
VSHFGRDFESKTDVWCSYDLDLDKKLSEETTVLVENYTVSCLSVCLYITFIFFAYSYRMDV